jgi:hypothetical protein
MQVTQEKAKAALENSKERCRKYSTEDLLERRYLVALDLSEAKDERHIIAASIYLEAISSVLEEREQAGEESPYIDTPTRAEFLAVGKYTKSTDPEMVSRMKTDGYKTGAQAVGEYVYQVDAHMFYRVLENLEEDAAY